jgi:hypothetical protein
VASDFYPRRGIVSSGVVGVPASGILQSFPGSGNGGILPSGSRKSWSGWLEAHPSNVYNQFVIWTTSITAGCGVIFAFIIR